MVTRTCPDCATEVGAADLICFTCGANLPRIRPAEEPAPAITIAQKAVSAEHARRISSAVLRISFPAGNVEVPAGPRCCSAATRLRAWWRPRSNSARTCHAATP